MRQLLQKLINYLRRLTDYLLSHYWQALTLTFLISLALTVILSKQLGGGAKAYAPLIGIVGIIFGTVGIIYGAFVTMVKNESEGALLSIVATLPYIITLLLNDPVLVSFLVWPVLVIAILSNVLTWVFAVMLHRQASWTTVLQIGALVGVLTISVIHMIYPEVADWWGNQFQALQKVAAQAQAVAGSITDSGLANSDKQLEIFNIVKYYTTGAFVAGCLASAFSQLVVARWWQTGLYAPGVLRLELHNIRLSQLAGLLFIGSIVLNYWGNAVISDIMPVLYLLFGAAGLSLIHYLFGLAKIPSKLFWLFFFYVALLITIPFSIVLLAFIALLDVWLDLRQRVKRVQH